MLFYTDGSCIGKKGGWAFCMIGNEYDLLICGDGIDTTNNRMELQAVIEVLLYMKSHDIKKCSIITDSKLIMNCGRKLWKRNKNIDLWEKFDTLSKGIPINWKWVKAHNGDHYNEIVDKAAREQARE